MLPHSKAKKSKWIKESSSRISGNFQTVDNRKISQSMIFTSTKRGGTKEEKRINRYVQSKKMKFLPSQKVEKESRANKLKPTDKIKDLSVKFDNLMIKSQRLYDAYDAVGFQELTQKAWAIDEVYERLMESNKLLKESNKMAFFFINFYKDFEQRLIYNDRIQNSEAYKICKEVHKEYNWSVLNFDIEEYEKLIEANTLLLSSYNPNNEFKDFKSRLEALNNEFLDHKNNETMKDLSAIVSSKDTSLLTSSNYASGISQFFEDKTRIATSNIDLTGLGEMIESEYNSQNSGNDEFLNQVYSRKNMIRTSYSQLESQVGSLEKNMRNLLKAEAQLKGKISRLRMERDSFKKLLDDNSYFTELQDSISNINTAILTHNSIGELKFNHQIMLKTLIDDDMRRRLEEYDII